MKHIIFLFLFLSDSVSANNSNFIALSSQKMRKQELDIIANNVANANTIGYESDGLLSVQQDFRLSNKKQDSFVISRGTYLLKNPGALKITNRDLDLAINGEGYFKLLTPHGVRYSLNGNMMINRNGMLVNAVGAAFASRDGEAIILPAETSELYINENGTVFANKEEVATIGIFAFAGKYSLRKEGEYLLVADSESIEATDYTIVQGALRGSNIDNTRALSDMVDLQRSIEMTNSLITTIGEMEKGAIQRLGKQ
jgi:flagellar basal-body rod protein FlgF